MEVSYVFLTYTIHIPPGSRNWPQITLLVERSGRKFTVALSKPVPIGTHEVKGTSQRVTDAQIPISITGEWHDTDEYFDDLLNLALEEGGRLIELLRIDIKEHNLKLRVPKDFVDVNVISVAHGNSETLRAETRKFKEWFERKTDTPLPYVDRSKWTEFTYKHLKQQEQPSLYQSLLLDAMVSQDTDPRVGILYAALACEVFIKSFLEEQAKGCAPILTWLTSACNPDNPAPVYVLYDLGLRMVGRRPLTKKENKGLDKEFRELFKARNDITHRGNITTVTGGYTHEQAISTARKVIDWVERGSLIGST